MRKENKTNSGRSKWDFAKSAFGVTTILALLIVLLAAWLQIQATLNWQSGMEYMFMVYAPFVLSACIFLFIRGIILLFRAARRHEASKSFRIALAVSGFVFLLPGGYIAYGFGSYYYVKFNAGRTSSNQEVLQLVQDCKVENIRRDYVTERPDQHDPRARVFLKDSAKSAAEKSSYFYGYRSFNPDYYDELAKVATEVQSRCGNVELYDERREKIPITYTWVSEDEALEALAACKISDVFTVDSPKENDLFQAGNAKSAEASIFMIMDPISEGFAGKIYIRDTDQATHSTILDFAKTKKGSCRYKQPNIDGEE